MSAVIATFAQGARARSVLDDDGEIEDEYVGAAAGADAPDGWVVDSSLVAVAGSVFRLSHDIAPDARANQLFLQEFGCTSP